jgi:hypothetical protein
MKQSYEIKFLFLRIYFGFFLLEFEIHFTQTIEDYRCLGTNYPYILKYYCSLVYHD